MKKGDPPNARQFGRDDKILTPVENLWFGSGCFKRKSGDKPPHSKDMETWGEEGLVRGLRFGMIWAFLQFGAHQRRAPYGTQPSPKS
jgi:hypothetical protein